MKELIRKIISFVLLIYPYNIHKKVLKKKNFIYTCWLLNEFKKVGIGTRFEYPLYTRGGKNIQIGNNCFFFRSCEINAWHEYKGYKYSPQIIIGNNCQFGPGTHITCCNNIIIKDGILTGANVIISDNNHGLLSKDDLEIEPRMRELSSKGEIIIEENVWIGDKVSILSGVHIGQHSIIAANSVVTHDVPACTIVAGVPAKIIRRL